MQFGISAVLNLVGGENPDDQHLLRTKLVGVAYGLMCQQADRIAELRKLEKSSKKSKLQCRKG